MIGLVPHDSLAERGAVIGLVAVVEVVLDRAEEWLDSRPRPAVEAERRPAVEVFLESAQPDLAVD